MTTAAAAGATSGATSGAPGTVRVVDDVPAAFADIVVGAVTAHRAAGRQRPFVLVCSGGPTARRCYEALARRADEVPWDLVAVLLGDERCVPAGHPEANQRLLREALLDRVPPVAAFVPFGPDDPGTYQRLLSRGLRPDLVHLGLGPDGHTASLFPGSSALAAPPGCLATANVDPTGRNPLRRLTLTFEAIARARLAVLTVAGEAKAPAWGAVCAGRPVPGRQVRAQRVQWLLDPSAAGDA